VPGQRVERIRVVITDSIAAYPTQDFPFTWFRATIIYTARGRAGETWQAASCDSGPDGPEVPINCTATCYEGGPEFKLAPEGRDGLRLELGDGDRALCRDDKAIGGPQDRVFVLRRMAANQCSLTRRTGASP